MKNYFLIIIILINLIKFAQAENLFESPFYTVEFISDRIEDTKIKKINEIKRKTITNILQKILDTEEFNKIDGYLTEDLINIFIKNIIINDEKIIIDKYKSNIKINFDKKKIISFFRENHIPYVEYFPKKILLIVYEIDGINNNLFTKNNNYYSFLNNNLDKYNIFQIPKLDINDRYILNKKHIIDKDIKKLINFSNKYDLNELLIVIANKNENNIQYDLFLYSDGEIFEKKLVLNQHDFQEFFDILNNETINIWKNLNQIQNKFLNSIQCKVNYFTIKELKEIKNKLNNVSIIKNLSIKTLSYKYIEYEINYYGNLKILFKIFKLNQLNIKHNENLCTIKLK